VSLVYPRRDEYFFSHSRLDELIEAGRRKLAQRMELPEEPPPIYQGCEYPRSMKAEEIVEQEEMQGRHVKFLVETIRGWVVVSEALP